MARHLTAVVVDRAFEVSYFIVVCEREFDRATRTLTFGVLNDCALDFVGMVNGIEVFLSRFDPVGAECLMLFMKHMMASS